MFPERTILFLGGDPGPVSFLRSLNYDGAYLVAVDRGLGVMYDLNLVPDVFVGDEDSVSPRLLQGLGKQRTRVVRLPARKNVSDFEAALDLLRQDGRADPVLALAGLGGRVDHLMFNLQLAARYSGDFEAVAFEDGRCRVDMLCGKQTRHLAPGTTVSFIPMEAGTEITLRGFEYPLTHMALVQGSTRTLSNVTRTEKQVITVAHGIVAMVAWKKPRSGS